MKGELRDFPDEAWHPSPLREGAVRARIASGAKKRKAMKRGVVKRLMGNISSIMMTCTAAASGLIGASVQGLLPQAVFGSAQPDVMEISTGNEITASFSCWGWYCLSEGSKSSMGDLGNDRYQKRILEKIEREQPRLVVFNSPRTKAKATTELQGRPSQQHRRVDAVQRHARAVSIFLEKVCDVQLKGGRDVLGRYHSADAHATEGPIARISGTLR